MAHSVSGSEGVAQQSQSTLRSFGHYNIPLMSTDRLDHTTSGLPANATIGNETSNADIPRGADLYTERTSIRKRNLYAFDIFALILNKQIGTGIFTTPGFVLATTQGKGLSVFLWFLGGIYCLLCFIVYFDYGTAYPYNGGELIYLNTVWPLPRLLSAVLFAGFFVSLGHTAGNAVAFSRLVLSAAEPFNATAAFNGTIPFNSTMPFLPLNQNGSGEVKDFDKRLVNLVAVCVLSTVCLLHYFSQKMGLFLNKIFATYKIVLIFIVACFGIGSRLKPQSGLSDFGWQGNGQGTKWEHVSGFIYIVYSYTGWENANYVIGEVDAPAKSLRRGGLAAISVVTILYTMLTVGFFCANTTEHLMNISGTQQDLDMATIFAWKVFGGNTLGMKICIALSAVGNLIAVVYGSSRVKQAIALHNFLPFSKFFAADSKERGTPGGALFLHWLCSTIVIVAIPNGSDGYGFLLGLFTYGQLMVGAVMGILIWRLRVKRSAKERQEQGQQDEHLPSTINEWQPFLNNRWKTIVFGFALAIFNLFILIAAARARGSPGTIPRWEWPVILCTVFLVAGLYWMVLRQLQGKIGKGLSVKVEIVETYGNDYQRLLTEERRDGVDQKYHFEAEGQGSKRIIEWLHKGRKLVEEWVY